MDNITDAPETVRVTTASEENEAEVDITKDSEYSEEESEPQTESGETQVDNTYDSAKENDTEQAGENRAASDESGGADGEADDFEDDFAPDDTAENTGGSAQTAEPDYSSETKEKKTLPVKKILSAAGIVLGSLAVLYLSGAAYYSKHFFFNTNIGNFDCSNLSPNAAAEKIKTDINDYSFTVIQRDGTQESISGNDIDLAYVAIDSLDKLKEKQNPFLWFTDYDCRELPISIEVSYDENALYEKVVSMGCVAASNNSMNGATDLVYYDDQNMTYAVSDTGADNIISVSKLFDKVKYGISNLYMNMYLDAEGCYVDMSGEDNMRGALDTLNRYVSTKVTYTRGEESSYLDGGSIHEWLTLGSDYSVTLDTEAVRSWVTDLAGVYNTVGSARSFVTSYGDTVTVYDGDYGWRVDVGAETDELVGIIRNGGEISREPVYSQTAGSHGPNNDLPNTYVEVNINAQHVWFYKDGQLIVSTDCVTGDPTKNHSTHTGIYYIKYKERNATLKGEDYETPVSYWMPFNGGEGLHDLGSRGAFGGGIYRGNGSHGCVNLPPSAAATIYENIERGVPVVVF